MGRGGVRKGDPVGCATVPHGPGKGKGECVRGFAGFDGLVGEREAERAS